MKQNKALKLILGVILAAALAVGLWFGVKALTKRGETEPTVPTETGEPAAPGESTAPTGEEEEDPAITAVKAKDIYTDDEIQAGDARYDLTVVTVGGESLTNKELQIHYGMQYINFMNSYGYYAAAFGLDTTKPLNQQQSYIEGLTWEQMFLMAALEEYQQIAALAEKAKAEGVTLPEEERASLDEHYAGLAEMAQSNGFASADELIQADLGPGADLETYKKYLETEILAGYYRQSIQDGITWTEDDLKEYYDTHPEEFEGVGTDTTNVNVRHILFLSDADEDGTATDEEKAAAKAKAEAMLAEYLKDPTEDRFAELAGANTEDTGSKDNGGLYEDVYPGQMVQTFNDWCFDAARKTGDTGLVETEYGFHVMYFVKHTDTYYWKTLAEEKYVETRLQTLLDEICEKVPMDVKYEDIVLAPLPVDEAETG